MDIGSSSTNLVETERLAFEKTFGINGSTKIMGIIGDPIAQARTPQIINPIFQSIGANIVCTPMHIAAQNLQLAWTGLKATKNLIGFGITLPHKIAAVTLCDSLDPVAKRVGAVNVVRRETNGELRGYQFDGTGFVQGLLSQNHILKDRHCLVIGAGGAAAAIVFGLVDAGVSSIKITNRTLEKAKQLADYVNQKIGTEKVSVGDPIPEGDHQLIVNATSLGMRADEPLPMPTDRINSTMLIAEVVANPPITRFLKEASSQGAAIHSGEYMVSSQVKMIARHFAEIHK